MDAVFHDRLVRIWKLLRIPAAGRWGKAVQHKNWVHVNSCQAFPDQFETGSNIFPTTPEGKALQREVQLNVEPSAGGSAKARRTTAWKDGDRQNRDGGERDNQNTSQVHLIEFNSFRYQAC
jgi:hypothetical protein